MIGIVCYGLGNVQAIANIYKRLNIPVILASTPEQLQQADRIVLPGVGAFDWAMQRLNESGMREELERLVLGQGRPCLGICVGMQMLAYRSDEGNAPGLGWIPGVVRRLDTTKAESPYPLPHMGWNTLRVRTESGLFSGFDAGARFYFLHSYCFMADKSSDVLATTEYCEEFACSVGSKNVFGVQFHPEKSHSWGIRLLSNFSEV